MPRDIFSRRINIKPYEYPELLKFKDAIRHSYWLHTEYNYTSDVHDYKVNLNEVEQDIIKKTLLSISQIEVNVKRFWGSLYNLIPKPEIDDIGGTFAESEVRHKDAYSHILERLGLDSDFTKIIYTPVIKDRIEYLEDVHKFKEGRMGTTLRLILFSLLVEHVSLFGQFYIIMSFNKRRNLFKGISNVVEATSKEENIHGEFGVELFKIIVQENQFDKEEFNHQILALCQKAVKAETKILDWIFEEGSVQDIQKEEVQCFILNRFNKALASIGIKHFSFEVDKLLLKHTMWFDEELIATKESDHFNKRSTDYNKNSKSFTEHDLFN